MLRKIIPAIFIAISLTCTLAAQDFNHFASFYKPQQEVRAGDVNFRMESLGFFQNNEYLGGFVDGYTLPGALVRPKLTYSPTDDLYIELGGQWTKYSGLDKAVNVLPWFTARYRFSNHFTTVIGNLDQNNQHGLLEQLWEPERIYTDKPESGLQFLYSSNRLNLQTWINWEQFIQKGDPFQEHFTAGVGGSLSVYQNEALSVKLPAYLLFYHKGGEIDSSDLKVQTHANSSAGFELAINAEGRHLQTINLNGYWMGYKAITEDSNTYPFGKGHAYLLETSAQTTHSLISLSYWNAFQFIAPKGRLLYQSVSDSDPSFTQADRSMVNVKYVWHKDIVKDARVAFQVETYLDIPTGDLSYSYGFFLLFNHDFFLFSKH
jgi:hypothetical protein